MLIFSPFDCISDLFPEKNEMRISSLVNVFGSCGEKEKRRANWEKNFPFLVVGSGKREGKGKGKSRE